MAGYWLKLYTEILDDPKYYRLSDNAKLGMYELMLVAKKIDSGGYLPSIQELNFYTRKQDGWWQPIINELVKIEFLVEDELDTYKIRKFEDRQASTIGADRAKYARSNTQSKIDDKYRPGKYDRVCNPLPESPGIYFIHFEGKKTGYIGASKNISRRVRTHLTEMRDQRHPLYPDYSELGIEGLLVDVLASTDDLTELANLETKYINEYKKAYELTNTDGHKPNRHWNSAYESYGEKEIDTEIDADVEVDADSDSSIVSTFLALYPGLKPRSTLDWDNEFRELIGNHVTPEIMRRAASELAQKGMKVASPGSLVNPCLMVMQREKKRVPDSAGSFKEYINH